MRDGRRWGEREGMRETGSGRVWGRDGRRERGERRSECEREKGSGRDRQKEEEQNECVSGREGTRKRDERWSETERGKERRNERERGVNYTNGQFNELSCLRCWALSL